MAFRSLLTPPASIGVAIGTAGLVFAIYAVMVPNVGLVHATDAHDINVDAARKKAAITGGIAAAAVTLLSRDVNPWILGGSAVIISDIMVRHANIASPADGKMVADTGYGPSVVSQGDYGQSYGS